jgi:hypothetical protein
MKDRELLELAAKAAGYTAYGYCELAGGSPALYLREADFTGMWAPLTDDGDALRLAVKLGISIQCLRAKGYDKTTAVQCQWGGYIVNVGIDEGCSGDPDAAARRCIVRVAAKIGEKI